MLVTSTDGVGTKLKIAFMMDKHDTVGIDLVGHERQRHRRSGGQTIIFP